ncbi:MAG: imidazoleglycerol-phosphate dehydratase HisB [bacterium]
MRSAKVNRKTRETDIKIKINIDGAGKSRINSQIGFLSHMLETFAKHGLFDIDAEIKGDVHVDQHHTVEDTGIALGQAFKNGLGNKKGLRRAGFFIYPMDEALVLAAIDLSGRPYLKMDAKFKGKKIGDLYIDSLEDFFQGFVSALGANLHIKVYYGRSDHHKVEAIFKAFGRSLYQACEIERRLKGKIPSTKGQL